MSLHHPGSPLFPYTTLFRSIAEMSPEANRQKATVQVKVQILKPDSYLRPEMNATVQFKAKASEVSSNDKNAAADRKSTRLNSSHRCISYAVFCLKKKKKQRT